VIFDVSKEDIKISGRPRAIIPIVNGFKGKIKEEIEKIVNSKIPLISVKANSAIAKTKGYITYKGPFEYHFLFDWSVPSEPLVNSTSKMLTAGIKG
jgi:hypothetical protein